MLRNRPFALNAALPRRIALFLAALLVVSLGPVSTWADEDSKKPVAADEADSKTDPVEKDYKVPEGSPKELLTFIAQLDDKEDSIIASIQSPERTQEERLASLNELKRLEEAIVTAADRVLKTNPEEAVTLQGVKAKFDALLMLVRTREETARDRLFKFAEAIVKDKRPAIADEGQFRIFQRDLAALTQQSPEQKQKYLDELKAFVLRRPVDTEHFALANTVCQILEQGAPELAADAYNVFGEHFAKSDHEALARAAQLMQGAGRRLALVGNSMDVEGTLLSGEEFDWSNYKGKVVLVDFWATWCPPCVAELPNMLKNYELYHDKGFEIVGISLDHQRGELERFIADKNVPWAQLFHEPEPGHETNPMAGRYGVTSIPFMVLVGRDGKAISTNARGAELNRHLKTLFGPPAGGETGE